MCRGFWAADAVGFKSGLNPSSCSGGCIHCIGIWRVYRGFATTYIAFNASCNPRLEIESSGRRCGPWALALGLCENWGVDAAGGGRCGGEEGGVEKGWSGVSGGGGARGG